MYLQVLFLALVGILLPGEYVDAVPPLQDSVTISNHSVILVVSFDGFRYDYFDKVPTPAYDALKESSVRVPYLQPVFPTMTFPNHQSIATGVYAETHGIVDNEFYDPNHQKNMTNDDIGFWNYHPDVLPIWLRNEMAGEGRASGCLMWPGSSFGYGPNNDSLPTYYFPGYDSSVSWEDRVDTVISWMTNSTKPANLVFLYFNEPDSRGHAFGPNNPETLEQISLADNRTGHLVGKLKEVGIFDKINLIMLSDHGMAVVTPRDIINITQLIEAKSDLIERGQGETPLIQYNAKEGKVDELYEFLLPIGRSNNFTVWKKGDLDKSSFFYSKSRRIMDLIVVADQGHAFDDYYSSIDYYNGRWNLTYNDSRQYGMHGYDRFKEEMRAYFLAHGPDFKENFDHAAFDNVDIVPLISAILGIPEPPTNGSLSNVENMLSSLDKRVGGAGNMIYSTSWLMLLLLQVKYFIDYGW